MKRDGRCFTAFANHLYFAPTDIAIPSRTHRLHRRFFSGKACGIALIPRTAARFAVRHLSLSENSLAKSDSGARPRQRALDSFDLDHVDPGSYDLRHDYQARYFGREVGFNEVPACGL